MPAYEELNPSELQARRQAGELWQLVDVREAWEVDIARVDDALHIPMAEIPSRLDELDDERPLAVLCHSGGRSARVAGFLAAQGFATVVNVTGGIDAWSLQVDDSIPRY